MGVGGKGREEGVLQTLGDSNATLHVAPFGSNPLDALFPISSEVRVSRGPVYVRGDVRVTVGTLLTLFGQSVRNGLDPVSDKRGIVRVYGRGGPNCRCSLCLRIGLHRRHEDDGQRGLSVIRIVSTTSSDYCSAASTSGAESKAVWVGTGVPSPDR